METTTKAPETNTIPLPPLEPEGQNLPAVDDDDFDPVEISKIAEKHRKKNIQLIKCTDRFDWVVFLSPEGDRNWQLSGSGCAKLMALTRLSIRNVDPDPKAVPYRKEPTASGGYMYVYSGILYSNLRSMPIMGVRSSDDKFFSMKKGEKIPIESMNEGDILKASQTNMLSRGLKQFLGFGSVDEEYLDKYFKDNNWEPRTVGYVRGAKGGDTRTVQDKESQVNDAKKRDEIRAWCLEMGGQDADEASRILKQLTAFGDFGGFDKPDRISGKSLNINYKKVKEEYEKWVKTLETSTPQQDKEPPVGK